MKALKLPLSLQGNRGPDGSPGPPGEAGIGFPGDKVYNLL